MSDDRPIPRRDVAMLMAPALGQEKSDEVVMSTARGLSIARDTYSHDEVRAIFASLVTQEGLVGVVARFAISRGDLDRLLARATAGHASSPGLEIGGRRSALEAALLTPDAPAPATATTIDLVALLAPALGSEKAREAIEAAAARAGVDVATGLTRAGALAVLEEMTRDQGILGVVARYTKARVLLGSDDG